jgi:hypothetical protein
MKWAPLLAVAAVSCGEAGVAPVQVEEFGAQAMTALCDWAVRCRHVPDEDTCRRLIDGRAYDVRRAIDTIAAGRALWDPEAAGRCVAETRDGVCPDDPFAHESCGRLLIGLVPRTGACTSSFDCADGAQCAVTSCDEQCCLGTCGAPQPPPEPIVRAPVGEPCEQHLDCVAGAYCELDRRCTAMPGEPGEHCLFGCAWGDLYCDVFTETCKRFAGRGEACDTSTPCDPAWSFCDGVCRDLPGPGETCDATVRRCAFAAWCGPDSVCVPLGTGGVSCTADEACQIACDESAGACVAYQTCG